MKKIVRSCMALGAFFVVALAVAACGGSSVSSSNVAEVAGNPISKQAFNHWMYIAEKGQTAQEAQEGTSAPVIVPTDPPNFTGCIAQVRSQIPQYANASASTLRSDCKQLFSTLSSQVMSFLIEAYWYQGTAYKDGIRVTQAQLDTAFNTAAKQEFPTAAAKAQFTSQYGETINDVKWDLRVKTIFGKLLAREIPKITPALEMQYYKAHPSEFGTPAQRNILIIQTNSASQIAKAESALKSGQSWASVAKQYSISSNTKNNGGVMSNVQANELETAVNKVVFSAPLNKLEGPIKGSFGEYLVKVTKIIPAVLDPFSKEQAEIKQLLTSQLDQSAQTKITNEAKKDWGSETHCAPLYQASECVGYKAPTTSSTSSPAGSAAGSAAGSSAGSAAGSAAGSSVTSTSSSGSSTVQLTQTGSGATGTSTTK